MISARYLLELTTVTRAGASSVSSKVRPLVPRLTLTDSFNLLCSSVTWLGGGLN